MTSSLSEDEFHRMQLQLIELRTTNYELDGKCKKQERDVASLNDKVDSLDRQLQTANKAIQKSKKAKETELLLQENDNLQRKLLSQEEDFRLQNQTLMQELTALVATNEVLEKELNEAKTSTNTSNETNQSEKTGLEDEIRSLQAQNTVLQKNLTAYQEKIDRLNEQIKETDSSSGATDKEESQEEKKETNKRTKVVKVEDEIQGSSTEQGQELSVLKLKLDTETEEKRMLKEKLMLIENENKTKIDLLQEELDKTSEKLKRKQESFVHLQEEKENLFKETNKKLEDLQSARDRDQKYYTDQINKLQQELQKNKQTLEEDHGSSDQTIKHLQGKLQDLQQQLDASDIVNSQKVKECSSKFEKQIEELHHQLGSLQQQRDDLVTQLQASKTANQEALDQMSALQQERDGHIQQWQEINKVAEKRKTMLDELANKYQRDSASHQEKVRQMEEDHEMEVKSLEDKLTTEHKKVKELENVKVHFEELKQQLTSLEEAKGWLERTLKETEEQLLVLKEEKESEKKEILEKHQQELEEKDSSFELQKQNSEEQHKEEIKEHLEKETLLQTEVDEKNLEVGKLKQQLKDEEDGKKIHEKKGLKTIKDLKRQLQAERKRADKIQEKLQEVLTDTKHNKSVEELLSSVDRNDSLLEDRSSVSSWNTGYSHTNTSVVSSPQTPDKNDSFLATPVNTPHYYLEEDNNELVNRVADLQQEKWNLEEKVSHLETSNSAMAEDIIQKTKIIEHYVRDTGSKNDTKMHSPNDDKLSLKKVLDLVNKSDEQNLKEMNKKLQRMLEETLTKNMHLEQNLEAMSLEIVRLSKLNTDLPNGHNQDNDKPLSNNKTCDLSNPHSSHGGESTSTLTEKECDQSERTIIQNSSPNNQSSKS